MFRKKPQRPPREPAQTAAQRREEARLMSDLVASAHLSESHNGRYARALIWTVLIALGLFIYWAALTPVYEIVSGNGTIRPEGLSTRIEHREGGIVQEIAVSEGDRVVAGDVIARLYDADLQSELQKLQASLDSQEQNIARYRWLLSLDLTGPGDRVGIEEMASVGPAFLEEVNYRIAQIETMRAQREVTRAHRDALESQLATSRQELGILRGQLERFAKVEDSGLISLSRIEDVKREALRLESSIAQYEGEIAVQTATILQVRSTEAELVTQYRRESTLLLDQELEKRIETKQSILQLEDRVVRSVLRAPVTGILNALAVQNEGEVVSPGEIIAEIIPENTRAFAEIEIAADRIGGVAVGRDASLKVLTYDFTRFGDIPAIVERISPSSFVKDNGDIVFRVQLSFSEEGLETSEGTASGKAVSPGMTVVADIKSERRTILSFLLKPVRVIADRAFTEA